MAQSTNGVNIVITGDASQATKEVEKLSASLGGLKDSSVKITADSSEALGEADKLVQTLDALSGTHIDITADSSQAVDEVEKVADNAHSIEDSHVKITADGTQAADEAEKTAHSLETIGDAHSDITADGSQATDEAGRVQNSIDSINGKEVEIKLKLPEDWLQDLDTAFNSTASKIAKHFERAAEQSAKSFKEKFREVAEAMDNVSSHFESGFGAVLLGIGAKIASIVGSMSTVLSSALAIGGGFEAQMTSVQVISGATADELELLTAKAREMGATLPISAKNAAEAMTLLVQRGTSVKDTLAIVEHVANLAISQGTDMAQATELLGSVLTNFKMDVADAAKVVTILNNASNQSPLTMSKMQEALKYIGPTAGAMGMSLTEAMAALEAAISAVGSAEMAGTGLTTVLTKISKEANILGVATREADGSFRSFADIFSDFREKGFGINELQAAFGTRGKLVAIALTQQSAALKDNEKNLEKWGSTQAAVDAKAKTFTNTMAAFRSALEELHIEIFEQIKNESKDAVSGIAELTRTFSAWIGETKIAQKVLQSFLDGLGFSIPTGADFKKLLSEIDVDLFVEKFKSAGSALKDLGSAIATVKDVIEAPLEFLIDHMETFASITFWGWILDKGLAIPSALLRLGEAFSSLGKSIKFILGLNLASIPAFFSSIVAVLSSPALLGAMGVAGLGALLVKKFLDIKEAKDKLKDALKEEEEFLQQQAKADSSLELDIQVNMKTGFEKLPEAWAKASDELRNQANATVEALRETFRDNVGKAIDEVIAKSPEMSAELEKVAANLSHADMSKLTKALQGDKEVFNSLSEPLKHVVEQLLDMEVVASQAKGNVSELITAWKSLQEKVADNDIAKSNSNFFSLEISASINDIIKELPDNIEKLKNFLGDNDLQLPVTLSLEQANKQLQEVSNSISQKFNIPVEIVNSAIFSQLNKLAETGNKTAQALRNGWQSADNSLDSFLQNAQDAIHYLNVSPDKFLPALNSLYKNIQKVDPLTGKLTEQFKKAYDALKQWANVTFDQLSQRIQRLKKAVEGGFIDKSALEKEAKSALQQIKVQVVTDLEPLRDTFKSKNAYYSTIASEVYNKAFEMGGDVFADALRKELQGYYDQSGASMGRAFVEQVQKGLSNASASIKINEIEMLANSNQSQSNLNFQNLSSNISESIRPSISKLESLGSQQSALGSQLISQIGNVIPVLTKLSGTIDTNNSVLSRANDAVLSLTKSMLSLKAGSSENSYAGIKDYSSEIAQVIKEIQNVSSGLASLQSLSQANLNAVKEVANAVSSLEAAIKTQQPATPEKENSTYNQSALNELSKNLASLQVSVDALKNSADSNVTVMGSLQNSFATSTSNTSGENFSNVIAPLINSVQSLAVTVENIQSINQSNSSYVSSITPAVKSLETAIKAIDGGNNYDIDIHQEGFVIQKKSDADLLARNTVSALRTGFANGGV